MAVPKTTATRCRDRAYKHCTYNPIPTSFFHAQYRLPVILQHKEICHVQKKRCRDGVICAVFVCPLSTPSCCGFWHCHPYIPVHFWKMFYLLVNISNSFNGLEKYNNLNFNDLEKQSHRKIFRSGEAVGVSKGHIPLGGSRGMPPPPENFDCLRLILGQSGCVIPCSYP